MGTGNELVRADHGMVATDAGGEQLERVAETNTAQLEAQARAMVQARFFIARQPGAARIWDQVEQKLRKECVRPGFANSAWWVLPIGSDSKKYPKGLSIRFAEAALRMSGNIDVQTQTVYDDSWKRIVRITVLDLETNFAYTSEATIDKTVERKDPKDRQVLSVRQNSENKLTYVVAATEQEVALKQGSAVSKAIRTNGLRLIPGDILDECRAIIQDTIKKGANAEDPEAARKTLLDSFAEISVMPADIAKFLDHDTTVFQPAERELLRGLYRAIRDGNTTWREVMEEKARGEGEASPGTQALRDMLAKTKSGQNKDTTETQPKGQPANSGASNGPAVPASSEVKTMDNPPATAQSTPPDTTKSAPATAPPVESRGSQPQQAASTAPPSGDTATADQPGERKAEPYKVLPHYGREMLPDPEGMDIEPGVTTRYDADNRLLVVSADPGEPRRWKYAEPEPVKPAEAPKGRGKQRDTRTASMDL